MKERTEELVRIPDARTMDSFITKQYYDHIVDGVNDAIRSGELARLLDGEILTREILDVVSLEYTYWQINEDDLVADVSICVDLAIKSDDIETEAPIRLSVGLWFDTSDDFRCECEGVFLSNCKPQREGILLDRFLVPIFGRDDIERNAERIWRSTCPAALLDDNLRTPLNLAKLLDLTIVRLPLYRKDHAQSMLFFTDGEVEVEDEPPKKRGDKPKTHIVVIQAHTIVLNTKISSHDDWCLCIYHECIHFIWHRMFYRLQDKHNSDDSLFEWIEKKYSKKKVPSNPLRWMEFQADRGAYALMLPESIARPKIERIYSSFSSREKIDGYYFNHRGWRAESAVKALASSLMLKKFRVKARMKQLGYTEVVGAMNFADNGYTTPYALSEEYRYQSGDNYSTSRSKMLKLYRQNESFRKLMGTGNYVYADGLVCMNDERCIRRTREGLRLTAWANAHVDLCCLNFPVSYDTDKEIEYAFGSLNSEARYNQLYNQFLDKDDSMTLKERLETQKRFMDNMPSTFPKALTYLMEDRMKVETLSEKTGISIKTLSTLRNEERSSYAIEQIIIICVALHLPPWLSDALLDRAHLDVKRYGPFGYYREILDCYFMDEVSDVQEYVVSNGYEPLSTRSA